MTESISGTGLRQHSDFGTIGNSNGELPIWKVKWSRYYAGNSSGPSLNPGLPAGTLPGVDASPEAGIGILDLQIH